MKTENLTNILASGFGFGIAGFFSGLIYSQQIEAPIAALGIVVGLFLSAEFSKKQLYN